MRILFLSRWYPFPPHNGSKIRIYNLLRVLSEEHEVDLIALADPTERVGGRADRLDDICRSVRVIPRPVYQPTSGKALAALLSSRPRYLVDTYSQAFTDTLHSSLASRSYDLIVGSQFSMMPYAWEARDWPVLLEELELGLFRDAACVPISGLGSLRTRLTWAKMSRYLRTTLPTFSACTVASSTERQHVLDLMPDYRSVHLIPNCIDVDDYAGVYESRESNALVFSGALTYDANYHGMAWFLDHVYPAIQAQHPSARLRITGSVDGVDLSSLRLAPGCELTGHVADIRTLIARSTVSVVPLLTGGGTRLKILESMALGTPVVATTKGAEGLDATPGEHLLVADTPSEFASYVATLLGSPGLRQQLAERGRAFVRSHFDWKVVGPKFLNAVEHAAHGRSVLASGSLA